MIAGSLILYKHRKRLIHQLERQHQNVPFSNSLARSSNIQLFYNPECCLLDASTMHGIETQPRLISKAFKYILFLRHDNSPSF